MSDTISEGYKSDDIAPSWADRHKEERRNCRVDKMSGSTLVLLAELEEVLLEVDESPSGAEIVSECTRIMKMLLEKNRAYGDSAINPTRCFSKASAIEQINVRLDDKISRLMSAQPDETEDVELDLIGYLVLKQVAIQQQEKENVRSKAKDAANGFGDS